MSIARVQLVLVLALVWAGGLACSPPEDDSGNSNSDNTNLNDNGDGSAGQPDPGSNTNDNGSADGGDNPDGANENDNGGKDDPGDNGNDNSGDPDPADDNGNLNDNGNANGNGNENDNANTNDNSDDNDNDNGGTLPDDPGDDPNDDCPGGFTLTVQVSGVGAGTVVLDPPGGCYAPGEQVQVTAQANPTYTFAGYSGAATGSDPQVEIPLDGNRSVSATFIGNLFMVSSSNHLVLEINPVSGAVIREFVPPGSGGLDAPFAVVFDHSGQLYITSQNGILEFDGTDGTFVGQFVPLGAGGLTTPFGITFGPNQNLFVTDTDKVREYDGTSGAFVNTFVSAGDGGLSSTTALKFGPADTSLYVTGSGAVLRYDGSNGAFLDEFVQGLGNGSFDIVFGPNSDLFVSDALEGTIARYDGHSGEPVACPCLCLDPCPSDQLPDGPYLVDLESLPGPSGLAFSHRGTLLVANQNSIVELDMLSAVPANLGPLVLDNRIGTIAFIAVKPLP